MSKIIDVAPFVGAWIEIMGKKEKELQKVVAPFVGAWIEINYDSKIHK